MATPQDQSPTSPSPGRPSPRQQPPDSLFPADFLDRLEYLSLVSKRVFGGQLMAQRRSRRLGSGLEFADHRDYVAGDDFRHLDWNLYARHGSLLIKRFQEEEDLQLYIWLDISASMSVGQPPKFNLARQVAAGLAYIALSSLDRVSLVAGGDGLVEMLPPARGKARILGLMQTLRGLNCRRGGTDLARTAREFTRRQPRPGLVVVISDLLDPQGFQPAFDRLRHQRFELHIVQLFDPSEAAPNLRGDVELLDVERPDQPPRIVTLSDAQRSAYQARYAQFLKSVDQYAANYGVGLTRADSTCGYEPLLMRMMRGRE